MGLITYADKSALNVNSGINDENKCNASDMNEIKNEVNTNASYTTTEQQVGSWLGEILYRKVISVNNLTPTTGNYKTIAHGITNFKELVNLRCIAIYEEGTAFDFNNFSFYNDGMLGTVRTFVDATNIYVFYEGSQILTDISKAYFTLEYTKNSVG